MKKEELMSVGLFQTKYVIILQKFLKMPSLAKK